MARLDSAIPTSPLVDAEGIIRPEWRQFFTRLWLRTGGAIGQSTDTSALQAQLDAEEAARIQGDSSLGVAIDQERAARIQGDAAVTNAGQAAVVQEAQARQQGDAQVASLIYNSTTGWQTALNDYVLKTQLCTTWAACDLSFLPHADPGGGKPWLDGIRLSVGTAAGAMTGIGLEDASGVWAREDGTGAWLYG